MFRHVRQRGNIRQAGLNTLCLLGNPAIAWNAPNLRDQTALMQLPNKRVFAAATTKNQDSHRGANICRSLHRVNACLDERLAFTGLCVDTIGGLINDF
jgi:hypothetical protein